MHKSIKGSIWFEKDKNKDNIKKLVNKFEISHNLAVALFYRKIDTLNYKEFLDPKIKNSLPNPSLLKGIDLATEKIFECIIKKKKIGILGDYDVDGATSTALLIRFLKSLSVPFDFFIPDRIKDGYGPNIKALRDLSNKGCEYIVLVDCGTTSFEVLKLAKMERIKVIVVDHHLPGKIKPDVYSIINPNMSDDNSGLNNLAAVGVVFLLIVSINRKLQKENFFEHRDKVNLLYFLDLVALGTICDLVTLDYLNRSLVKQGLKVINQTKNVGIKTLIESSGLSFDTKIDEYHLGYMVGPRINAGGRVGKSYKGVELLISENESHCKIIAEELSELNNERQKIEKQVEVEALRKVNKKSKIICVVGKEWHQGVIGIVSSKLTEKFSKPSIVISEGQDICVGSCRSVNGFDIGDLIKKAFDEKIIVKGGGHKMAAGLTLKKDKISHFDRFISMNSDFDKKKNKKFYEFKLFLSALNEKLFNELNQIAPFGPGNPRPKIMLERCLIKFPKLVGTNHISFYLSDLYGNSIQAISFKVFDNNVGDYLMNSQGKLTNFIGYIGMNSWQNKKSIQFQVIDVIKLID